MSRRKTSPKITWQEPLPLDLNACEALRVLALPKDVLVPEDIILRQTVMQIMHNLPIHLKKVAWYLGVLEPIRVYTQIEVAGLLGISQATVSRRWQEAQQWIDKEL